MDKLFTEDVIKDFLEAKLYERRGISRDEYIEKCKKAWEQTNCKEGDYKVIIDELYDYSKVNDTTDYNDKLLTDYLKRKDKTYEIKCCCLVKVKWEDGGIKEIPWDEVASPDLDDPLEPEERRYLFALFDVLGFEALHAELGTTKLYQIYKDLIDKVTAKDSFSMLQTFNEPNIASTIVGSMPLQHHYFSDTIILWTPMSSEFISPFCARCADIICESILMGIPLRGAISSGRAILNKNKGAFLGHPVIEAARVESQQNWIGVSFCPTSTEPRFQLSLHPDLLIQNYTDHFKPVNGFNKYISLMTLDWPKRARERNIDADIIRRLHALKSKAPVNKQIYYEQTLAFVQHSLNVNDWYKSCGLIIPEPLDTIIKLYLINGDELEGALPGYAIKSEGQYFLLVPKENIELLKDFLSKEHSITMETLSRIMYVIPKTAIARLQLLREEPSPANTYSSQIRTLVEDDQRSTTWVFMRMQPEVHGLPLRPAVPNASSATGREPNAEEAGHSTNVQEEEVSKNLWDEVPKDLAGLNEAISRIFVGAKNYEIFLPTLNTIHLCARNLIFVNLAIPEGETWNDKAMGILHTMELVSHRDFINAVDNFRKQVDLSKETDDFFTEFLSKYKKLCETFIGDVDSLLVSYDPNYKINYAPSVMEKERFHLLGLMTMMLCHLTQIKEQ